MSLTILLARVDKTYRPGSIVSGVVRVSHSSPISHNGLTLIAEGTVKPQLSAKTVGFLEAFVSSVRPIVLCRQEMDLAAPGKFPTAEVEIPFEFELRNAPSQELMETYRGVYVSIGYTITANLTRGAFSKSLSADVEFFVEVPTAKQPPPAPLEFSVTPETLSNVKQESVSVLPKFLIKGTLQRTNCSINQSFTGEFQVEFSAAPIKSIELQLVRVETVSYAEGKAREATEILNLQLADGDVCRKLVIPIYVLLPRHFTCPTVHTDFFSVEFELNLIVLFEEGFKVIENFPIVLYR